MVVVRLRSVTAWRSLGQEGVRVVALGLAPGGCDVAACVVYQQVDGAEFRLDAPGGGVHRGGIAEVAVDGDDGIARQLGDFVGDVAGGGCLVELPGGVFGAPVYRYRGPRSRRDAPQSRDRDPWPTR